MLSWDFTLADKAGHLIGSVNRNFRGFARELFTDTGAYVLRLDAAAPGTTNIKTSKTTTVQSPTVKQLSLPKHVVERNQRRLAPEVRKQLLERASQGGAVGFYVPKQRGLTLDQRAVMLATAVSIDFDYFSYRSGYQATTVKSLIV